MVIGWKQASTRPASRQNFSDNPTVSSKNVRRYGRDGSKGDFPESSTGEQPASQERRDLPASLPASHVGRPGRDHVETVGYMPDGSGRFKKNTHPEAEAQGIGNATFDRAPLKPKGMADKA